MKASELMTQDIHSVAPSTSLRDAANLMGTHDLGILPVVGEDEKVVGTVTDRDITVRGVARGNAPDTSHVRDIMSREVITCSPDSTLEDVAKLMQQHRLRRVLVSEGEKLAGVISIGDVARAEEKAEAAGKTLKKISEPAGSK